MSVPAIPSQPLHDANGKVIAYVVPSEQYELMKTAQEALLRQREAHSRQLRSILPKATAEQEAAMAEAIRTGIPNGLRTLLAELEAEGTADDGR